MVYELKAKSRDVFGKKLEAQREQGLVPAVIYGTEVKDNVAVFLDLNEFKKVYEKVSGSAIVNLVIEGESKPREVLIKEVAAHPVKGTFIHIDFYQIKHGQKLEVEVELNFVGIAPAVKVLGGILIKNMNKISIKCLPEEILASIDIDLSTLETFESKITVGDLKFPASVEVLHAPEEIVASVSAPMEEEVVVAKPAEATSAAPAAGAKPAENGAKEAKK